MASLEDQIRSQWGQYGDWNAAGQDQVAALAGLFRSRGVDDLSKLQFKKRTVTDPAYQQQITEDGTAEVGPQDREVLDAYYGDQAIGFLGDISRDGSYGKGAQFVDGQDAAQLGVGGDILAWSAQGGGNTTFKVVDGPDGQPVVVPTWASSKQDDLNNVKTVAMMAAMAYGGAALGGASAGGASAGGAATTTATTAGGVNWGSIAATAGKSAAMNAGVTLARGGNLKDALKSGAIGAVTGAAGGALAQAGVNSVVAGGLTGAGGAALRGGDGKDILLGGATGALSTYAKSGGITGNATVDQALVRSGTTMARGGNAKDALLAGGTDLLAGTGRSMLTSGSTDDALSEENIVRLDGAGADDMTYDDFTAFNFDEFDPGSSTDMTGGGFETGDVQIDPYGPGSGYGDDTLSNMGAGNDTNVLADGAGGQWFGSFMKSMLGDGKGGYLNGAFGRDLMTMIGAGIQGYGLDKAAREGREYQERIASEKRRRQMPVGAIPALRLQANRGGA